MTTLADCFFESRKRVTGLTVPMVVRGGDALSAGDFVGHVHGLALALEAGGIQPGQRVAVIASARVESMVVDWACFLLGAISVPLDPTWPTRDLGRALRNAGTQWIFYGDGVDAKVNTLTASLTTAPQLVALDAEADSIGTTWTRLIASQAENRGAIPLARFRNRTQTDDPAMIVYLPSPAPEGLVLNHRMLVAALAGLEERLAFDASDRVLTTLPTCHPLQRLLSLSCWRGGIPLIHGNASGAGQYSTLNGHAWKPTVMCTGVEALSAPDLGTSIRRVVAGSPLETEARDALLGMGVEVVQATCAAGSVLALDTVANRPTEALGRAIAGVALRVGDEEEILARGPAVPESLWQCEDGGTCIGSDGWLRTGLRGWVDPSAILFRHRVDPAPGRNEEASSTTSS